MKIGFIGFGSMAKAIARGLIKEPTHQLFAAAPSLTKGINAEGIQTYHDNKELVQQVEIIILAVKPSQMDKVINEINAHLSPSSLVISVAAGLSIEWFANRFTKPYALIRTMPNTPASIGLGATPMFANTYVSRDHKQWAEAIFSSVGLTHWAKAEEEMDVFTALSGSGPAYVFLFVEALTNAAIALGLESAIAQKFALQTCRGALKLAENTNLSLSQLRTQVTSPGGTTAAALGVLEPQLEGLIHKAMQAAQIRAEELGKLD
ncbi:pyrroline-5-carboxylate reductase [Legionella sp. km772]|nr:pyrroline-5-carboxylate reductase [Legionella sp. km772]